MPASRLGTVSNVTRERLRVGIWSGHIVLNDLQLRPDALDAMKLPVQLVEGRIGRLQIRVPWSRPRLLGRSVLTPQLTALESARSQGTRQLAASTHITQASFPVQAALRAHRAGGR